MEAKHWGLRKSRNATSLNSRFKSIDTLKVKIISVTFRRVIRTNHKKASKIWRHENIQLGGCYFFFQAEDGIRDLTVTGVQTCALPISRRASGCAGPAFPWWKPGTSATGRWTWWWAFPT